MKKTILSAAFLIAACLSAEAQSQRLALYEEFTGESCPPCASTNPGLWERVSAAPDKTLLIKYQVPIPAAGAIYTQNPTYANNRSTYYSVNSAPNGRVDGGFKYTGIGTQGAGHPIYYQADSIDAAAAVVSPFTITAVHSYNTAVDSLFATITVTCTQAFAPASANMKLRVAYVQTLEYPADAPPGTNGEYVFENVVRRMYPDANGSTVANSWTVGQTQTYMISGPIQSFVDKANKTFVVAWLQNDNDKAIAQTGKSSYVPLMLDAGAESKASLVCGNPTVLPASPFVVIKNTGTTTITTATINYKIGSGAQQTYNWSGNLATGVTADVALPAGTLPAQKNVIVYSITSVNGGADVNPANNASRNYAIVHNNTLNALPSVSNFDASGTLPAAWTSFDVNNNGQTWAPRAATGYKSLFSIRHENYNFIAGETNYAIMPTVTLPAGAKKLSFEVAYAQYQTEQDKLEVVYSTNCGQTWTSVWSKQGDDLSTVPPSQTAFTPASASDWRLELIDVSSVPVGAIIALKATSDFGNNLYVDSVVLSAGPASVGSLPAFASSVSLVPNPTSGSSNLTLNLEKGTKLSVQVMDMTGRVVNQIAEQNLSAGTHIFPIATDNLAAGVYNVRIATAEGVVTQRLSVVK